MNVMHPRARVWFAAVCLVAMIVGQTMFLPWQARALGEVGRPQLPEGIVRLPFDGEYQITQVPGCGEHTPKNIEKKYNEMNVRAFDFGLPGGTEVRAAGEGFAYHSTDPAGALILRIEHQIDGRDSGVWSYYVHLSEFRVDDGSYVYPGVVIGLSGNTGLGASSNAEENYHLHFAVTEGGDPATTGHAANVNSLPGIPWDRNNLNDDGYVTNCELPDNETAFGYDPVDDTGSIPVLGYDRGAAVDAAFQNLQQGGLLDDSGARFVSSALWAGGLPRSDVWSDDSATATNADDLIGYLTQPNVMDGYSVTLATRTPIDWPDNTASGAELGDVIAYDWEGNGTIDQVAVVLNFNDDGYPEVSQYAPTAGVRYWSVPESGGNWIEDEYPGSAAYLIQISPLTLPEN